MCPRSDSLVEGCQSAHLVKLWSSPPTPRKAYYLLRDKAKPSSFILNFSSANGESQSKGRLISLEMTEKKDTPDWEPPSYDVSLTSIPLFPIVKR